MHAEQAAAGAAADAQAHGRRQARGARTLRRRPPHLHRRSLLHPALRLPPPHPPPPPPPPASPPPPPPPTPAPRRREPITKVINSCVGCGLCGEVAHAAVLCPSFYRASLITNPTGWDRGNAAVR